MNVKPSCEDVKFKDRFEAGEALPSNFHHRDHLRLVFVYLCESDVKTASQKMRSSLKNFLKNNDIPVSKYHETLTYSWVQAVKHFMEKAGRVTSFDAFIRVDDRLLDTDIMLTHYARETLFSEQARAKFVPPDIQPIPYHP